MSKQPKSTVNLSRIRQQFVKYEKEGLEVGCEKCGEPTNNAEPICQQCWLEEQEYWRDVNDELNQ